MRDWPSLSEQFAMNLREAKIAACAISADTCSIDDTVARTRETIAESRRVIAQTEELLLR